MAGERGRALVGALAGAEGPEALEAVVDGILQAVGGAVPDLDHTVLGARDDDGQLRVEAHGAHVVRVALQRLHARLGLVVPHLGQLVVRATHQVRAVACAAQGARKLEGTCGEKTCASKLVLREDISPFHARIFSEGHPIGNFKKRSWQSVRHGANCILARWSGSRWMPS